MAMRSVDGDGWGGVGWGLRSGVGMEVEVEIGARVGTRRCGVVWAGAMRMRWRIGVQCGCVSVRCVPGLRQMRNIVTKQRPVDVAIDCDHLRFAAMHTPAIGHMCRGEWETAAMVVIVAMPRLSAVLHRERLQLHPQTLHMRASHAASYAIDATDILFGAGHDVHDKGAHGCTCEVMGLIGGRAGPTPLLAATTLYDPCYPRSSLMCPLQERLESGHLSRVAARPAHVRQVLEREQPYARRHKFGIACCC